MNRRWKRWIAGWVPPHLRQLLNPQSADRAVRYSGNYTSWAEARRHSAGYDAPAIVEKVKQAIQKVQRGEAAYERDSVLFDQIEHSFPLLTALYQTAQANSGRLDVIDIGGSLGSTYFQCRGLLGDSLIHRWRVVEQPLFAECGRQHFQSKSLHFFEDLQSCLASGPANVVLLSSVLPYVEAPHELLETLVRAEVPRVIVDRTPIWSTLPDRLTVQTIPPSIYGFATSYPAWILNREGLLNHFRSHYRIVFEFDALAGTIDVDDLPARDAGFFFERLSASV